MILLDGDKLSHQLIKNLAAWTTRERGVNRRTRNHNRDIGRMLQRSLLWHAWLGVSLKVRCVIRRIVGVLKFGFGSVNLKRMMLEISSIRNFRANHLGSNLRLGAEAQFIHHAVQMRRQ